MTTYIGLSFFCTRMVRAAMQHSVTVGVLLVVLVGTILPPIAEAQRSVNMSGAPSCAQCTIELQKVAELGGANTPFMVGRQSVYARDGQGNIYAGSSFQRGMIGVFSPSGQFLRTIGRSGSGPGEFRDLTSLMGWRGDTVFAFDEPAGRVSRFTAGGTFVSSGQVIVTIGDHTAITRDGLIAVRGDGLPDISSFRLRFHGLDGELRHTYSGPVEQGNSVSFRKLIAQDIHSSGVWVVHPNRLQIDLITADARLATTYTRSAPWFEPWTTFSMTLPYRAPSTTYIRGVTSDAEGRLFLLATVPQANFRARTDTGAFPPGEYDRYLDTIIEVFDPRTERILVSHRLDLWLHAIPGSDLVYNWRYDADGAVTVDIYRPVIRGM